MHTEFRAFSHSVCRARLVSVALLVSVVVAIPAGADAAAASLAHLKCEYQVNPIGIDSPQPRLSWQLRSDERGATQTAYQVQVGRGMVNWTEEGILWDTGRVASSRSIQVPYAGPRLESGHWYSWRVRVWDNGGRTSGWSAPAHWEMGLLRPEDWQARWIAPAPDEDTSTPQPAPVLRGAFTLDDFVESARAYVTSLGLYELEINGRRVGDHVFTPGWTSYHQRLQYQVYDVTDMLRRGRNVVGATLGDGWYRGSLGWGDARNLYGKELALLFEIRARLEDGRVQIVGSDETWKAATGPILHSDISQGEAYDARLERPGWSAPGYDDSDWAGVRVVDHSKRILIAPAGPPVRRINILRPVEILRTPAGETVVDLGQSIVGWVRLKILGVEGSRVTLRHAEALDGDGNLSVDDPEKGTGLVTYVLKGGVDETYEPHFTIKAFRYVAVDGYPPGRLTLDDVTGMAIHSDMPRTGRFETSSPLLNRLQHNIQWGQKGNVLDVPTDRLPSGERVGWTGGVQAFARTAAFNMDVAGFFTKWLGDLAADQEGDGRVPVAVPDVLSRPGRVPGDSAAGGGAAVIVPWTMYLSYGDTRLLETQYDSMKAWVGFLQRQAADDATAEGGLIATAFFAHSTALLQRTAEVLGRTEDAAAYAALLPGIKATFQKKFVTEAGRAGEDLETASVLALHFDLLSEELRPETARRLAADVRTRGHLTTTSVSTPYLCHVLSRYGELDLAYQLLTRQEPPSWLAPVTRGATTTPSFNHSAYGAIGEWMYRVVAGLEIDPDDPGYRHVLVQPQPGGGLSSAEASLETPYGEASSAWALLDEGRFSVSAVVPPNARGTIRLPNATLAEVTESDAPITSAAGVRTVTQEDGAVVVEVGSGRYRFEYPAGDLVNRLRPGAETTGLPEESLQGQNGDPSK